MAVELVTVTVSGANGPQTRLVPLNVDPASGTGSALFSYTGEVGGSDAISASVVLGGVTASSNAAQVNWVQPNGPISVSPITATFYNGGQNYTGTGGIKGGPVIINSLVINQIYNNFPLNGWTIPAHPSPWQYRPFQALQQDNYGNFTGIISLPGTGTNTDSNYQGQFLVSQPGTYTFYFTADDSWVFFLQGATLVSLGTSNGSSAPTSGIVSKAGYPLMGGRMNAGHTIQGTDYVVVSFAQAGVYGFEIGSGYSGANADGNVYFMCTYAQGNIPTALAGDASFWGTNILPAINFAGNPATSTVTTPLGITPSGGAPNLQLLGNTITLTLQVVGATLTATPYLPLLEGQPGQIYISNNGVGVFSFPGLPDGSSIDYSSATGLFSLAGSSNASNQNTLAIVSTGGGYKLAFNGAALDPSIPSTNVVVSYKEFAWYNSGNKTFDPFTPTSGGGGGRSAAVQVYWLVNPSLGSVQPASLVGDGGTHTITVTLSKALPPTQAAATAIFTGAGGITVLSSQANTLSNGFVTGWTVNVQVALIGSTAQASLTATISDTLTYLHGDDIVTNLVTYVDNITTLINLTTS